MECCLGEAPAEMPRALVVPPAAADPTAILPAGLPPRPAVASGCALGSGVRPAPSGPRFLVLRRLRN
jgi:hypothetical protein